MGSISAQVAATKVSATIRKGKKVILAKILTDTGYSASTADSPSLVTNTQSFRQALALEQRPLIEGLQKEINRIKEAMASKDLKNEEYRVLTGSLDIMIHNYQLLTGGATERQVFVLPSEVMERNSIKASEDNMPKLDDGSIEPVK